MTSLPEIYPTNNNTDPRRQLPTAGCERPEPPVAAEQRGGAACDPVTRLLGRLHGVRQVDDRQWSALCPAHRDQDPSLSVGFSEDGRILLHCHAACSVERVVAAVGLDMRDLFSDQTKPVAHTPDKNAGAAASPRRKTYASVREAAASLAKRSGALSHKWPYQDADGNPALCMLRFDGPNGKTFRPLHPVEGGWQIGDPQGLLPLYRLPQITREPCLYIAEGEGVADAAVSIGLPATTSAHGAKSAKKTDWGPLAGKDVVVFPDNDDPGRGYAQTVVDSLQRLDPPARVKIVELPDLPPHGDLVDFIGQREGQNPESTREEIQTCVERTPWLAVPHEPDHADAAPERDGSGRLIVRGVTTDGKFPGGMEPVLQMFRQGLVDSRVVFTYGQDIVLDTIHDGKHVLKTLCSGEQLSTAAAALLANLFVCEATERPRGNRAGRARVHHDQFRPPHHLVDTSLHDATTRQALPRIALYARRPVFDRDFVLRGPGWHPDVGILVHGPEVEPILPGPVDPHKAAIDRLPPHLHELLRDFCFQTEADLANALAMLVTGMMSSVFIEAGKPIALLDGNQPDIGKTLLSRVFGMILDGEESDLTPFTSEDAELGKRICATLRGSSQTLVVIDNAKLPGGTAINSVALEALATAPKVTMRILGHSRNLTRPNDLLWAVTMNNTKASPDLVSRGIPIRLRYVGRPEDRNFDRRDPVGYSRQYRNELIGELLGMVEHWRAEGAPHQKARHRFVSWGEVVGGILWANHFPEFLRNLEEASAAFDDGLDEFAAVAEAAVGSLRPGDPLPEVTEPRVASKWDAVCRVAGVLSDQSAGNKSARSRSTIIGRFLGKHMGRTVPIEVRGQCGSATLRSREGRGRKKEYWFALQWDGSTRADARRDDRRATDTVICPKSGVDPGETANVGGGNSEAW